jgi:hypothetical protein
MKGIFWNSRGLSDLAKTRFLRETSKEVAFIALLETSKNDFPRIHRIILVGGGTLCGTGLHLLGDQALFC